MKTETTVNVSQSLLRKVIAHFADSIHEFREAETAPDGSIEIESQEMIESEEAMLVELRQTLASAEQPSEGDVGREELHDRLRRIAQRIADWIRQEYTLARNIGPDPGDSLRDGIVSFLCEHTWHDAGCRYLETALKIDCDCGAPTPTTPPQEAVAFQYTARLVRDLVKLVAEKVEWAEENAKRVESWSDSSSRIDDAYAERNVLQLIQRKLNRISDRLSKHMAPPANDEAVRLQEPTREMLYAAFDAGGGPEFERAYKAAFKAAEEAQ